MTAAVQLCIRRDDFGQVQRFEEPSPGLEDGGVRVRVDRFALTANNISYALFGDELHYWDFFPAPDGWGIIPVWGFAVVEDSRCPDLQAGERLFGYWPMATTATLIPERVEALGFFDGMPHRRALHATYNRYLRVAADPSYHPEREALQAVFQPLFATSFLIDRQLADADFFGAERIIVSSASAKTALGLAHCLKVGRADRRHYEIAGLTSQPNVGFVQGLDCYDRVLHYEDLESLPDDQPACFVDIAGDVEVRERLHGHLGEALRHSSMVGASHGHAAPIDAELPGANPTFFFAPGELQRLSKAWGKDIFARRFGVACQAFYDFADSWLELDQRAGPEAVEAAYRDLLAGRSRPDHAVIATLWPSAVD